MITTENAEAVKREFYKSYLILVRTLYLQSEPELTVVVSSKNKRLLIGSILFLAFAMESFINDFGANFIENFEDLERIEPLNKFILFPRITKNNSKDIIKKGEDFYASLKKLFKYRDYFVHYKPAFRPIDSTHERLFNRLDHAEVKNLYSKMINLLKHLNNHFKMFKNSNDWISGYSDQIKADV